MQFLLLWLFRQNVIKERENDGLIQSKREQVMSCNLIGRLRFHYDKEYENDNEISLSFSIRFCTQRDERLMTSISSSTTAITEGPKE